MMRKSEDAALAPAPILLRTTSDQRRRLRTVASFSDQTYVEFVMAAVDTAERKMAKASAEVLNRPVANNPWA